MAVDAASGRGPNRGVIRVFVDTSALRKDPHRKSASLRTIYELSQHGHIALHIHTVAWREFSSQTVALVHEQLERAILAVQQAERFGLPEPLAKKTNAARSTLERAFARTRRLVDEELGAWRRSGKIQVDRIAPEHADRVFEDYFAGYPPFQGPKKRDDLPDAFIFAAVCDRVHAVRTVPDEEVHVIVADKRLADACAAVGAFTHESFDAFLRADSVQRAVSALDQKKRRTWMTTALATIRAYPKVEQLLADVARDWLLMKTFRVTGLGSLATEVEIEVASVREVWGIQLDWDRAYSYGTRSLVVPAAFALQAQVEYIVSRDTYYGMRGPGIGLSMRDGSVLVTQLCQLHARTRLALDVASSSNARKRPVIVRASLEEVQVGREARDVNYARRRGRSHGHEHDPV
jgi:PIN domain